MTDKQNFEKDINVPSKEIITHSCDAKDCEQYYPEHICCHCRNAEWYGLRDELKAKEQECEELKKELHKNFEEKDKLHLIIDRLLEAGGYDTNTASAEDFEGVYENMRYEKQQLDQLEAENEELKKTVDDLLHKPEIQDKILWKIDNEALLGSKDAYIYKLEKTLTEIKEVVKNGKRFAERYMITGEQKANVLTYANAILQKISECGVK